MNAATVLWLQLQNIGLKLDGIADDVQNNIFDAAIYMESNEYSFADECLTDAMQGMADDKKGNWREIMPALWIIKIGIQALDNEGDDEE